jgi:predicted ATPase
VPDCRNPIGFRAEFRTLFSVQVRQLVTEYCVLPIGSQFVHENAPLVRSVLLYGNPGCGKTLLVRNAFRSSLSETLRVKNLLERSAFLPATLRILDAETLFG